MKKSHDVRIETKTGEFIAYLSHKGRVSWSWKTAMKHALDYLKSNPDHKCRISPC